MRNPYSRIVLFLIGFNCCLSAVCQVDYVVVNSITIHGNSKTKTHIITRELDFAVGDTIFLKDTSAIILSTKNKLYNTALFNSSTIYFIPYIAPKVNVYIEVSERWYIWPSPIFEIGDRNFNEWWQDRNKSADRLDYGLRFRWENFRGRNEQLKLVSQLGFTKKFELFHFVPYINKNQTLGIRYGASYSTNNQVAFATENDKLAYFKGDSPNRRRFYSILSLVSRPHFFGTHELKVLYKNNTINDTISRLNNSYFLNGDTRQSFFDFSYEYTINTSDIRAYPLKGIVLSASVSKTVGDVDMETFIASFTWFKPLTTKWYMASKVYGKATRAREIPYFNMLGLGYDQHFVRGFERQVIDANHYVYNRNSIRYQLLKVKQDIAYMIPLKEFDEIPYVFYLTGFVDSGFSKLTKTSPLNTLNNEALVSAGLGLDIVTYYDLVFRFEYALTNKNSQGFFIHFEQAF